MITQTYTPPALTIKDLDEMTEKYKTKSTKKAFITKLLKQEKEYFTDIYDAYKKRGDKLYGWYLGRKIFAGHVRRAEADIKLIEKYKENI